MICCPQPLRVKLAEPYLASFYLRKKVEGRQVTRFTKSVHYGPLMFCSPQYVSHTEAYMSPEVVMGSVDQYETRVDSWSLGVLIFVM